MSQLLKRLSSALTESRWDDYDEIWLDAVETDDANIDEYLEAARRALRADEGKRAGMLLTLLAPQAASLPVSKRREFFETLCVCVPNEREHRESLMACFEEEYGEVPGFSGYARAADLRRTDDPGRAIQRLHGMLRFLPGAFVFHRSGWGVGEIKEVSALEGVAVIDFQEKAGHRVKLEAIPQICDRLESTDFKVRTWRDREGLKQMASDDAIGLVKLVLGTSERPMPLAAIREHLAGVVIPTADWSKWWSRQRNNIKKDPQIGMGGGRTATYFLQEEAQGIGQVLERRLQGLPLKERVHLLREAVADASDAERHELDPFIEKLGKDFLRGDGDLALRLETLLFLRRTLPNDERFDSITEFLDNCGEHPAPLINLLTRNEDALDVMRELENKKPDEWPELHIDLVLRVHGAARDYLISRLLEAGRASELDHWAREINRVPKKAPMYFLWLTRMCARKEFKYTPSLEKIPPINMFLRSVNLLDDLSLKQEHETTTELSILVKRYRSTLGGRPYTLLQQSIEGQPDPKVRDLYGQIEASRGFSTTTRQRLLATVLRAYPDLLKGMTERVSAIDQSAIYSTEAGIAKLAAEIEEIRNEKLPAIFKAIGDAAAMGDLSENYEFTSAIEERENLNRRVLELQSQLDQAVPINLATVDATRVSIGTRISLTNLETKKVESYALLGPWDSDPNMGILSYNAPLGRALLDHAVGEEIEVELPDGTSSYRVDSIEPYKE